jgi:hypothetical protein
MRTKVIVLGSLLSMLALLLPGAASAKRITVAGSVAFTKITPPPTSEVSLTSELVVTAVMSNPGLEKTVTQQLPLPGPLYVLPFFVDEEKGNSGPGNLGTVVALTNTTGSSLTVKVTIRDAAGELMGSPELVDLMPFATKLLSISDLID